MMEHLQQLNCRTFDNKGMQTFYEPATTHCYYFTIAQLRQIIVDYLSFVEYYTILEQLLHQENIKYQNIPTIRFHNSCVELVESVHPLKVESRVFSKRQDTFQSHTHSQVHPHNQKSNYNHQNHSYFYLYPFNLIVKLLQSQEFFRKIPQKTLIHSLLSTTNINIIKECLRVLSVEMSQKIKYNLYQYQFRENKMVKNVMSKLVNAIDLSKETSKIEQKQITVQPQTQFQLKLNSIINLACIPEEEEQELKIKESNDIFKSLFSNMSTNTMKIESKHREKKRKFTLFNVEKEEPEYCNKCSPFYCFISELTNESYSEEKISKIAKQPLELLKIIAETVVLFRMFLVENNQMFVPADLFVINTIINAIGLVVPQQLYERWLHHLKKKKNPENGSKNQIKTKNLYSDLQPYYHTLDYKNNLQSDTQFSIEQLFALILVAPTVKSIKQNLISLSKDDQQKILKSYNLSPACNAKEKKNFQILLKMEAEKASIKVNFINAKPIYKQINEDKQEQKIVKEKIQNYNAIILKNNSSTYSSRSTFLKASSQIKKPSSNIDSAIQKISTPSQYLQPSHFQKGKLSDLIQMKDNLNSNNNKYRNLKTADNLKRSMVKTSVLKLSRTQALNDSNHMKLSESVNVLASSMNNDPKQYHNSQTSSKEEELTNQQFKKILYNAYLRNNGMLSSSNNTYTSTVSTRGLNNTFLKTNQFKKTQNINHAYFNSIRKEIKDKDKDKDTLPDECIEKKERLEFNKQQLNGSNIRNEVMQQLEFGVATIHQHYQDTDIETLVLGQNNNQILKNRPTHIKNKQSQESDLSGEEIYKRLQKSMQNNLKIINQDNHIIIQNAITKYNTSGNLRNHKYIKNIKDQLTNYKQQFLLIQEYQNKIQKENNIRKIRGTRNHSRNPTRKITCSTEKDHFQQRQDEENVQKTREKIKKQEIYKKCLNQKLKSKERDNNFFDCFIDA